MAKLTIQIPSTTYTHSHTSSTDPNPLPISSSVKDLSSSTTTYPYSHRPPSPCLTDTDSDSMLSLELADAPPSPSPRHTGDSCYSYGGQGVGALTGQNSSLCKPLAPTSTWDHGSGSSPAHLQSSSNSNSWVPRANYELTSDSLLSGNQFQDNRGRMEPNANLPLPNPHPPSTSFPNALTNLNNPLPYPRTPSASSSTSSKSGSEASSNSNSSYVTSASSTSAADYLRPPSSPNGFKARTPSPLGERRGKTPSLLSNGSSSPSPAPRLAHRTSSPSPLSSSFFLASGDPRSGILPQLHNKEDVSDPSFSSNRATSPLKRPPSTSSSFLLNNPQPLNPYHGLHMQRSESPTPMDDTPKANGKVRLVGNGNGNIHPGEEPSPTRSHSPLPFNAKPLLGVPGGLQQPTPQAPLPRSQTPRSFSRSEHDLTRVSSPGLTRPNSRTGTRLPVPPTLMPAHHRNSSSTSLVSSMSGFTGGLSGGMAGNRPLSGFIGDLTFGGPSPTSPSFHPNSFGGGNGSPDRTDSGSGSFVGSHRRAASHDHNGVGVEPQRTGSSATSCAGCGQGQGYASSVAITGREQGRADSVFGGSFRGQGHARTPSNGSWVPGSASERVGNALLLPPPPPPHRHGHGRSHSCDYVPLPQSTLEKKEKEEEDETIFTGYGGIGRPTPSPSSSPVSPSFPPPPQSRPLPIPTSRHPSRSSSSFIVPQRPYSAMGGYAYAPSFSSHSEVHLKSQSTGGLSLDPTGVFIGNQSTGTTAASSWMGSQPTGGTGSFYSSLPPSVGEDSQGERPDGVGSSPTTTSANGKKKLTKSSPFEKKGSSRDGCSPSKSGGSSFNIFGKRKGKGIVNGDGVLVTGIGGGVEDKTKEKEKRSSPLKKLGISLRSLSPKKQQMKEEVKSEGLIWSNPS